MRDSPQVCELLGSDSQGWTEKRASDGRLRRKAGDAKSNSEKREAILDEQKESRANATYNEVWAAYQEINSGKSPINKVERSRHFLHVAPFLGERLIGTLQTSVLTALCKSVEKKGLSTQTVKHVLGLVRRVLRWGVKQNLCCMPENLIFDMPHVDNQKTETMTQSQLAAYLKSLDEEQDQVGAAILLLALTTGMRKTAILSLRWEDIDLERSYITLRGENAKSGKTDFLPLNDMTIGIIRKIPRRGNISSRARMEATGKASKGWPAVFVTRLASRIFALCMACAMSSHQRSPPTEWICTPCRYC